jgi:hypothetical protein
MLVGSVVCELAGAFEEDKYFSRNIIADEVMIFVRSCCCLII